MIMSNSSLRTRPLVESDRKLRFTELCNQEANQSAKRGGELKSATDKRRTKKEAFLQCIRDRDKWFCCAREKQSVH